MVCTVHQLRAVEPIANLHFNWTQEIAILLLFLMFLGGFAFAVHFLLRALPELRVKPTPALWMVAYMILLIIIIILTVLVGIESIVQAARIVFALVYEA